MQYLLLVLASTELLSTAWGRPASSFFYPNVRQDPTWREYFDDQEEPWNRAYRHHQEQLRKLTELLQLLEQYDYEPTWPGTQGQFNGFRLPSPPTQPSHPVVPTRSKSTISSTLPSAPLDVSLHATVNAMQDSQKVSVHNTNPFASLPSSTAAFVRSVEPSLPTSALPHASHSNIFPGTTSVNRGAGAGPARLQIPGEGSDSRNVPENHTVIPTQAVPTAGTMEAGESEATLESSAILLTVVFVTVGIMVILLFTALILWFLSLVWKSGKSMAKSRWSLGNQKCQSSPKANVSQSAEYSGGKSKHLKCAAPEPLSLAQDSYTACNREAINSSISGSMGALTVCSAFEPKPRYSHASKESTLPRSEISGAVTDCRSSRIGPRPVSCLRPSSSQPSLHAGRNHLNRVYAQLRQDALSCDSLEMSNLATSN